MSGTDPRKALTAMIYALRDIFEKNSIAARKKAWKALEEPKGKAEIHRLLNSPSRPIVGIYKLLDFKEWFNENGF